MQEKNGLSKVGKGKDNKQNLQMQSNIARAQKASNASAAKQQDTIQPADSKSELQQRSALLSVVTAPGFQCVLSIFIQIDIVSLYKKEVQTYFNCQNM